MVCKGNMNFGVGKEKFELLRGLQHGQDARAAADVISNYGDAYLAALTELTVMVLSFSVPVTVALAPACLSSVARAALSPVSSV